MRWAALPTLLLLSLGCSLLGVAPSTPVVSSPTPQPEPTITPAPPTPTLAPTSPPLSVEDVCPPLDAVTPPERSAVLDDDLEALSVFLSAGGDVSAFPLQEQEASLRGDITGDGIEEIVFTLIDPQSELIPPRTVMVIYTCREGRMTVLYRYEPGEWFGLQLITTADLTQDGVSELVFSEFSCGAHTCVHMPKAWSWQGGDFENRMGAEFSFPYPDFTVDSGELVVVSSGVGSVGAGPQRSVTTWMGWTAEIITITNEVPAPPTYRYHAFLDGEVAFAAGDYTTADAAYTRTIDDDSLEPWGAFSGVEAEREWFIALAHWRLMMLEAFQDRSQEAEVHLDYLMDLDSGSAGYPVVSLAERFWRAYERDGDAAAACEYGVDTPQGQPVLDFLNGFGYANPFYEQHHLCIVPEQ